MTLGTQKEKGKLEVDLESTLTCNLISTENKGITIAQIIEMENISCPNHIFRWKKDHLMLKNNVKSVLHISKEEKEDYEKPDFL